MRVHFENKFDPVQVFFFKCTTSIVFRKFVFIFLAKTINMPSRSDRKVFIGHYNIMMISNYQQGLVSIISS